MDAVGEAYIRMHALVSTDIYTCCTLHLVTQYRGYELNKGF